MDVPSYKRWLTYQPSKRRLRLFCCAAARHTPGLVLPEEGVRAVEVAERYADGLATKGELKAAWIVTPENEDGHFRDQDIADLASIPPDRMRADFRDMVVWLANTPACPTTMILSCLAGPCERVCLELTCEGTGKVGSGNYINHCPTCRGSGFIAASLPTLCGVPNHGYHGETVKPWCIDCRRILAHNDGTVRKIAQHIYDSRDFGLMGQLADALEEGGCTVPAILEHCRGDESCERCGGLGECSVEDFDGRTYHRGDCVKCEGSGRIKSVHARGCWILDCILGMS